MHLLRMSNDVGSVRRAWRAVKRQITAMTLLFPLSPGVRGERGQHHHWDISSRCTFSAVIGRSLMRTPTASATALAMAGAGGPMGFSPMPLALYGPGPLSDAKITVLSSGISWMLGILYSPKLTLVTLPSSTASSSLSA